MVTLSPSHRWVALFCRLILSLYFASAGLAILFRYRLAASEEELWIPVLQIGSRAPVYGCLLVVSALALLVGWKVREVAIACAALIFIILVEWISINPFYNTMSHLLPFLALALTIIWCTDRRDSQWTPQRLTVLFCRLTLGTIFLFQGLRTFLGRGTTEFARALYVEPLSGSWVPEPLLWVAGITNPYTQLITGALLLIGLWPRLTSLTVMAFLLTIFFGHVIKHPFDPGADVHAYAGANFVLAALVFGLSAERGNHVFDQPASAA